MIWQSSWTSNIPGSPYQGLAGALSHSAGFPNEPWNMRVMWRQRIPNGNHPHHTLRVDHVSRRAFSQFWSQYSSATGPCSRSPAHCPLVLHCAHVASVPTTAIAVHPNPALLGLSNPWAELVQHLCYMCSLGINLMGSTLRTAGT
jgi:hypothetical protein